MSVGAIATPAKMAAGAMSATLGTKTSGTVPPQSTITDATKRLSSGHRQPVGPTQDRVLELAEELGLGLFPTYIDGEHFLAVDGSVERYGGEDFHLPEDAQADVGEKRKELILCVLAKFFGPRAADPEEYVERDWAVEEWSRGCYGGRFGSGVWTGYGEALREPVGRIHWAGTETAEVWNGYMDGAVRSGERAAREVLLS